MTEIETGNWILRRPTGEATVGPKSVLEYPLPASQQTHELAVVGDDALLVISQQPTSTLLKVALDAATKRPTRLSTFTVGTPASGLHGVLASRVYDGSDGDRILTSAATPASAPPAPKCPK